MTEKSGGGELLSGKSSRHLFAVESNPEHRC